jgi:hypothetical protein
MLFLALEIIDNMPKCKICGKGSDGEFCFQHKPRTQLKQCRINHSLSPKKGDNDGYSAQKELFLYIWKMRRHYSEVSGTYLGKEPLSTYFHHILPKEKYPQACLDDENIILLTLLEHSDVESDMYKFEEINRRRTLLLIKYDKL